jgi:hypothetical protein
VTTARAAGSIEVCVFGTVDVPTYETFSNQRFLPNEVFKYWDDPVYYQKVLVLPTDVHISGLQKLDAANTWLFSSETPTTAAGAFTAPAEPRDIIKRDSAGVMTKFFCGGSVSGAVPLTSRIDALFVLGGDGGDLVVSFDVPTVIGGAAFKPSDLVRYQRIAGGTCSSWQLAAANPYFDSDAAGDGIPLRSNAVGAARYGSGLQIFSQDVPTSLSPPAVTVRPGELVAWNGSQYSVFAQLSGWPISSNLNAVANPGNPGVIGDNALRIDKGPTAGNIQLTWTGSCSSNGTRSAIYEGAIGTWYSHTKLTCTDALSDRHEEITPTSGSRYYLVVPWNPQGEGSYGTKTGGIERPRGTTACSPAQVLSACPN